MKNIPAGALLAILFGLLLYFLPHLTLYLLPFYLILSGILQIAKR